MHAIGAEVHICYKEGEHSCCVGGHYQLVGLRLALAELFVVVMEMANYKTLSCRKVAVLVF